MEHGGRSTYGVHTAAISGPMHCPCDLERQQRLDGNCFCSKQAQCSRIHHVLTLYSSTNLARMITSLSGMVAMRVKRSATTRAMIPSDWDPDPMVYVLPDPVWPVCHSTYNDHKSSRRLLWWENKNVLCMHYSDGLLCPSQHKNLRHDSAGTQRGMSRRPIK